MGYVSKLSSSLPSYNNDVGEDLDIKSVVNEEISAWKNKKENDFGMGSFLKKYWNATPNPENSNDPSIAWSAAFVSWLLKPFGFVGEIGHATYIDNVLDGKTSGWKAFNIKNNDKVRLNVGDILIYDRKPYEDDSRASHGDVVYQIDDQYAYLVGGNLSDSIGVVRLPIDNNGYIEDKKSYQIILKNLRGAKVWKKYLYGTFVIGWYGFLIYNLRKQ